MCALWGVFSLSGASCALLNGELTALTADGRQARIGAVTELTVGTLDGGKKTVDARHSDG